MAPTPLTLIGVMPGHALLGTHFTATSMIGMIALTALTALAAMIAAAFILDYRTDPQAAAQLEQYACAELALGDVNVQFERLNRFSKVQAVWTHYSHDFEHGVLKCLSNTGRSTIGSRGNELRRPRARRAEHLARRGPGRGHGKVTVVDGAGELVGIVALDDLLECASIALLDVVQAIGTERVLEGPRRRRPA